MIRAFRKSSNLLKMSSRLVINSNSVSSNPQNLPHLPIPKLQDTLKKFLDSVEPLVDANTFENTKNVVREFGQNNGVGEKLQSLLEKRAEMLDNWLSDPKSNWWLKSAYLQYRDPVVVWSSPGHVFPQRSISTIEERINFASKVIYSALLFKKRVDENQIPVEKMGKAELDMQQYCNIFGTCRIPGLPEDTVEFNRDSKHIALVVNDVFFKVPAYTADDQILGENQLQEQIKYCVSEASKVQKPVKIGVLTSDNRDNWANAYNELVKKSQNVNSIREIQKALFLICLDRDTPKIQNDDIVTAEYLCLTGAGSQYNSANRWYDKTIQFVIGPRGINGLTYEHSPAEGGPLAVLTDSIIDYVNDQEAGKSKAAIGTGSFEKATLLNFESSNVINECITNASKNIDKLTSDIDMSYLFYTNYGKNFIKSQKFSPDSFIQMAISLAFYQIHAMPAAQYESAATRLYIHGRTETIRSFTKESLAFMKSMVESNDDKEKFTKLKLAIDSHKKFVSAAIQGFGVDRHLFGLKRIANENGIDIPSLYTDEGYLKSSTFRLSTSQVPSAHKSSFMCYGPLTMDGYGCCYSPRSNDIQFGLSSMKSNNETSTQKFKKSLENALSAMYLVCVKAGEQPVKSKL